MKAIRKKNALIFDLTLFLAFTVASFVAYLLTDGLDSTGAIISLAVLGVISLMLVTSR